MRIKIGDFWFTSSDAPIMVELTEFDQKNITHMIDDNNDGLYLYAEFSDDDPHTDDQRREWMNSPTRPIPYTQKPLQVTYRVVS